MEAGVTFHGEYSDYTAPERYVTPARYTRRADGPRRTRGRATIAKLQRERGIQSHGGAATKPQRERATQSHGGALEDTLSNIELHTKVRDSDDESSVDENYDVASLAESIEDQLT